MKPIRFSFIDLTYAGTEFAATEAMSPLAFAALLVCMPALAQTAQVPVVSPVPSAQMQPGYGVLEEIAPAKLRERSAAAGGSAGDSAHDTRPVWRVKVRMADGAVQYRDLDRREFAPGDHVLLTNAGDVVP